MSLARKRCLCGKVFAVKWKGCLVAVKQLFSRYFDQSRTERVSTKTRRLFEQECSLLARLHHPHIVQLFGVHLPDDYRFADHDHGAS